MDEVVTHLFSPDTLKGGKFAPLKTVSRKPSVKKTNTLTGTILKPTPKPRGPQIKISDDLFTIVFPSVERIAKRIDYEDWTARMQLYKHMKKTGVVKALEEAGIKKGDTVKMGGIEWEWT